MTSENKKREAIYDDLGLVQAERRRLETDRAYRAAYEKTLAYQAAAFRVACRDLARAILASLGLLRKP